MIYKATMVFMIGLIVGNLIGRYLILRELVKVVLDGYLIQHSPTLSPTLPVSTFEPVVTTPLPTNTTHYGGENDR